MSVDIKLKIKDWIVTKNGTIEASQVQDDTRILEEKLISSLQLMDLILFLGRLKGSPIDMSKSKQGSFSSVNDMYDTFLAGK